MQKRRPRSKPLASSPPDAQVDRKTAFSDPAAREVLKQFRLLLGTIKKHYHDVEAACGLGGAQLWALAEIAGTPGLSVRDLAAAMLIHHSTASNLVERIEKMGLVFKSRCEEDKRVVRIFATPAGQGVLNKAPEPAIGILQDALLRLPASTLADLKGNLALLIVSLRSRDELSKHMPLADL